MRVIEFNNFNII